MREGEAAFYRHLVQDLDVAMLPGPARHEIAKAAAEYGRRCVALASGRRFVLAVPAGARRRECGRLSGG